MSVEMIVLKNRAEWLENRLKGIGGSEISAVIGQNPYMDNQTLWKIKTGRIQQEDISEKPYVKYGTKAEEYMRELFKLDFPQFCVEYVDNNSFTNPKYPFAQASLDGWMFDQVGRLGVLEIKTTEIINPMQRAKWRSRIPDNYFCQCIFYMAVMEADFCVLKGQLKSMIDGIPYMQTKHFFIERADVQGDIDYLMQKGAEFWEYVQKDKCPPLVLPDLI